MFFLFCFFKSQCIYLTVIVIATAWLNYLPDSETTYEFIHGYNTPTLSNNYNTMQLNVLVVIIVIRFAMYLYYEYIYFSYFTQCCVCGCVLCSSVLLISIFNIVEFLFLIFFFFYCFLLPDSVSCSVPLKEGLSALRDGSVDLGSTISLTKEENILQMTR